MNEEIPEAEIYYFDGADACELCQANTGYTLIDPPERPHPNCDCPIELANGGGGELPIPKCHFELRNIRINEYADVQELGFAPVNGCGFSDPLTVEIVVREDEEEEFDAGVREAAEAEGWREPGVIDLSEEVEVPPRRIVEIEVSIVRWTAEFKAEVWLVCEVGGERIESEVGVKTGRFAKNVQVLVYADAYPCGIEM